MTAIVVSVHLVVITIVVIFLLSSLPPSFRCHHSKPIALRRCRLLWKENFIPCPLTAGVIWVPQMTSQPLSSIFSVLHCPQGLGELQACPFLDVFPPLFSVCLVSSPPPPQWGAADAEIKVPSDENTEVKVSPFKVWRRSVYSHTCYAYSQGFLPCLFQTLSVHSPAFFPNLSLVFPVLVVANTWFLCRPAE